jgi:protein-S-isoprenylcysteine O-methyltransferase Ste14
MTSPRLSQQGFANLHRKLIFRLLAIILTAYLFYAPNLWPLDGSAVLCAQVAGMLLIFAGIIGRILATLSIGGLKDQVIVKTELYSVCRNPLYFASFLMAVGLGLLSGRSDFTVLLIAAFLAIFYPMMRNEARYLRARFEDFAAYEKAVPLFIPNFWLWQERGTYPINFRLVKRTLLDASLILIAIPVMILLRWIS